MTSPQLLPAAGRPPTAWKNGGGTTWQVASHPPGAEVAGFDWRVSLAAIQRPGAFSAFPGVDRTIVVIAGDGIELSMVHTVHVVRPLEPLSFAGEDAVTCRLLGGPTRDLNVMTRRGHADASLELVRLSGDGPTINEGRTLVRGETRLLLVVDGGVAVTADRQRLELGPLDAVCFQEGEPQVVEVRGPGTVADISIRTVPDGAAAVSAGSRAPCAASARCSARRRHGAA